MNKTEERLVERARKALGKDRLQSGVKGDRAIVEGLLALVERLDGDRTEYLRRWLEA